MLAKLEKPIYIGEVLVEHNPMLVDKFNVTSYPQFMNVYAFGRDPDKLSLTLSDMYVFCVLIHFSIIAKAAMGLDHQDLIEVKTMEQWNDLRQSISILTLGVFTTKEVASLPLSLLVRRIRRLRSHRLRQTERRLLLFPPP